MNPFLFQFRSTFAGGALARNCLITWQRPIPKPETMRLCSATPVKGITHA